MRIGVDIGGTKLEAAAIDIKGTTCVRRHVSTPKGDYAGTIEVISDLVSSIEQEIGVLHALGFGIPGTISPATG